MAMSRTCPSCGRDEVAYNPFNKVIQCHACGTMAVDLRDYPTEQARMEKLSRLPGWSDDSQFMKEVVVGMGALFDDRQAGYKPEEPRNKRVAKADSLDPTSIPPKDDSAGGTT